MGYTILDDGTLDTVAECNDCGKIDRFNPEFEDIADGDVEGWYDARKEYLDDFYQTQHECDDVMDIGEMFDGCTAREEGF